MISAFRPILDRQPLIPTQTLHLVTHPRLVPVRDFYNRASIPQAPEPRGNPRNLLGFKEDFLLSCRYLPRIIKAVPFRTTGRLIRNIGSILAAYALFRLVNMASSASRIGFMDSFVEPLGLWGTTILGFLSLNMGVYLDDYRAIYGKLKGSKRLPKPLSILLLGNVIRCFGFLLQTFSGSFVVAGVEKLVQGNFWSGLSSFLVWPVFALGVFLYDAGMNIKFPRKRNLLSIERLQSLHLDEARPWEHDHLKDPSNGKQP